jgi:hypothetical protein
LETTGWITHDSEKSATNESGMLLAGSHEICHKPLSPKLPRESATVVQRNGAMPVVARIRLSEARRKLQRVTHILPLQENKANLLVF